MPGSLNRAVFFCGCLILATAAIYSNTLHSPFTFDDFHNITDNPAIRMRNLVPTEIWRAAFESPSPTRPVANLSFALNYYFHQFSLPGFHAVNIGLHALCGCLLFVFLGLTLNLAVPKDRPGANEPLAFGAALLWTVHPLHTQSVTYIVQRMNILAALFMLVALICYIRGRLVPGSPGRWAWFGGAGLAGCLALGSKENAAFLPVVILLYELYFFQDLKLKWTRQHTLISVGVALLLGLLVTVYLGGNPLDSVARTYLKRDFTLGQRLLTEPRVVVFYLSLLLFPQPSRLNLVHDFPLSVSLFSPVTTLPAMFYIGGCLVFAVLTAKRQRLLSFCIVWYFANLVIESSVIGLEIAFEHRTYLPSMLVILLFVLLADQYIRSRNWQITGLLAVVLLASFWTYSRNRVYSDEISLWTDAVKKSPGLVRPHENLGNALDDRGRSQEAIDQYRAALAIDPTAAGVHYNLGLALFRAGGLPEARRHFSESLKINPANADAWYYLGVIAQKDGDFQLAGRFYFESLQRNPGNMEARWRLEGIKKRAIEEERRVK